MDELKLLSDDVFEQIKDFDLYYHLSEEQKSLIDQLIPNEELKERYQYYGLCKECKQPNTGYSNYCQSCNSKRFQQNFKNWTSGNHEVDKLIQKTQLNAEYPYKIMEWIEYDKFKDVEYLAKGGFGIVFKAIWKDGFINKWDYENDQWEREAETKVALKCLHDSQDITTQFLKEIEAHNSSCSSVGWIVRCFGITKDPETENFMMIMELKEGSLRQHLNNNFISMDWVQKFCYLYGIVSGLKGIHNSGLIHRDFHSGNILSDLIGTYITDLGLCQPANVQPSQNTQNSNKEIYGVLPYVAPEVIRGKEYTQASDIYAFGIIAYEICTGLPPYHDVAHDEFLAIKICQGLRPKNNYRIPQLLLDIINQCWDADPLKRPDVNKLYELLWNLFNYAFNTFDPAIDKQIKEVEKINKESSTSSPLLSNGTFSYMTHPQAIYTSKLLDFKNLPEPKNTASEYSESMSFDFTILDINSKDENN